MTLSKFCDVYTKWINRILIVLGLALFIAVSLQVLGRYTPIPLWLWPEEIVRGSMVWVIFLGSVVALREKEHFTVDMFPMILKGNSKGVRAFYIFLDVLYYIIGFLMAAIFAYYGFFFFRDWGMIQTSDITGMNLGYIYFAIPLAGVSWFVFLIESLQHDIKGTTREVQ